MDYKDITGKGAKGTSRMRAALWYGSEDMRIEETGIPQIGPKEVLVRIGVALTCGTDFKLFRQGHPHLARSVPAPFGHEFAGEIVEVGPEVERFKVGMRVVAANSAPCGSCFHCKRGEFNLCDSLVFMTGAYAEYIRVPSQIVGKNLHPIPDSLPYQDAALAEPLACVVYALDQMRVRANEVVCIIGAGPCGLMLLQLAKICGAKVIVVGRGDEKLGVAKLLGADYVFSIWEGDVSAKVRHVANDGYGPDVVVEAVGGTETWELAVRLARKGGRVCLYGGCPLGVKVSFDARKLHYEDITIKGVFHYTPRHFEEAVRLISDGRINTRYLITGEKKLCNLHEVFRKGLTSSPLKIAILP